MVGSDLKAWQILDLCAYMYFRFLLVVLSQNTHPKCFVILFKNLLYCLLTTSWNARYYSFAHANAFDLKYLCWDQSVLHIYKETLLQLKPLEPPVQQFFDSLSSLQSNHQPANGKKLVMLFLAVCIGECIAFKGVMVVQDMRVKTVLLALILFGVITDMWVRCASNGVWKSSLLFTVYTLSSLLAACTCSCAAGRAWTGVQTNHLKETWSFWFIIDLCCNIVEKFQHYFWFDKVHLKLNWIQTACIYIYLIFISLGPRSPLGGLYTHTPNV